MLTRRKPGWLATHLLLLTHINALSVFSFLVIAAADFWSLASVAYSIAAVVLLLLRRLQQQLLLLLLFLTHPVSPCFCCFCSFCFHCIDSVSTCCYVAVVLKYVSLMVVVAVVVCLHILVSFFSPRPSLLIPRIRFALDLYKSKLLDIDLPFSNPFSQTTMMTYNPRMQVVIIRTTKSLCINVKKNILSEKNQMPLSSEPKIWRCKRSVI